MSCQATKGGKKGIPHETRLDRLAFFNLSYSDFFSVVITSPGSLNINAIYHIKHFDIKKKIPLKIVPSLTVSRNVLIILRFVSL